MTLFIDKFSVYAQGMAHGVMLVVHSHLWYSVCSSCPTQCSKGNKCLGTERVNTWETKYLLIIASLTLQCSTELFSKGSYENNLYSGTSYCVVENTELRAHLFLDYIVLRFCELLMHEGYVLFCLISFQYLNQLSGAGLLTRHVSFWSILRSSLLKVEAAHFYLTNFLSHSEK